MTGDDEDAFVRAEMARLAAERRERALLKPTDEAVIEAAQALYEAAKRDTHQGAVCAAFLLGLYNGPEWPFTLTELRGLDYGLQHAAFLLLRNDAVYTSREVHRYLFPDDESGNAAFGELAERHGIESRREMSARLSGPKPGRA